jgi:hypothetical protein
MSWTVEFEDEFVSEFGRLSTRVQDALLAHASVLENEGPLLGRPLVDTLKNSAFPNMKELRFNVDQGVWRVVRFYQALIKSADARFARYLKTSQKVRSGHRKENKQCR